MPLTILIADDDLGTRLAVSDYLTISGYETVAAENGQQALVLVNQFQPHLIITDITMPSVDGYELIRQVRRQPAFRLLPVIFLTERTNTADRIRGYQVGCDAYLPKPFELAELGAVVRNLLDRAQIVETEWRGRLHNGETVQTAIGVAPPPVQQETQLLGLTGRERDVLFFLVEGLSNSQIGDRLHLSSRTVEKYVSSLLRKTDTNNRAELVRFTIEHQLLT
ncbi:MAG: response regulator transcription factor [Elainella sp. Prado103]|jgi:DNA-binding NarL/FixJ family response regulator|nr:response regulator transcription factor [Elainella sp. Prado103]